MLPKWLDNGIVALSNHEPLSFKIRRGGQRVNEKEYFEYEHSEDFVKRAADFGVTLFRTHYFKGSGLKHEAPEIAKTREFIKLAHKHGIKVQGYIQHGTISYETFFNEVPEAVDWVARDQYGLKSSVTYGYQFFRYKPCYNKKGFVDYIKKVVTQGIKDGLDMIGFDNSAWSVEPVACQCDTCKKKFIEFLNKKYKMNTAEGKKLAWERFAIDNFKHVQPPNWHRWAMPLNLYDIEEPMIQEWVDFKCEVIRENIEEINLLAKKLNPDVVMEWNCYSAFGDNGPFWVGVDIYRNMKYIDMVYNEQDPHPGITSDGVLLNMIRSFKLFKSYGKTMLANCNYHAKNEKDFAVSMSEHMAFNSGIIGMLPGGFNKDTVDKLKHPVTTKFLEFSAKNREIFNGTVSVADTAVLESYDTLANTRIDTHYSLVAVYQTLITGNVQFDILTLDRLEELKKYKLLVLPNVKLLGDVALARILAFVKNGGSLLVTEKSGMFDSWFRRRDKPLFPAMERRYGKGHIRYIQKLEHEKIFSYKPEDWYIDPSMWKLPKNSGEILKEAKGLTSKESLIDINAPYGMVFNLLSKGDDYILHALNYDSTKTMPSVEVILRLPHAVKSIEMISPLEGSQNRVSFTSKGGEVRIKSGKLERYKVFVIKCAKEG